uniref:Uncharacterized protein n=1 Tax=Musa acuminata TaxID=4641 RepID=Q1EPA2_MUSAC|nr:hypothetical protein MA4_54N07.40 [Musa acuminata]
MSGMKIVFTGNPNLMFDFNSFLSRWNPVTFEESLDFVKKVKARDYQLYLSLSDILSQKEQTPPEIYHNDHDDLCKELMRFKPHVRERRINKHNSFGMSLLLMSRYQQSVEVAGKSISRVAADAVAITIRKDTFRMHIDACGMHRPFVPPFGLLYL